MSWRLVERTRMVQTRVLSEATFRTCLISQCFIHPKMVPHLKEHTDFLWGIKWMPPITVSATIFFDIPDFLPF